jgi:hypothetical protein
MGHFSGLDPFLGPDMPEIMEKPRTGAFFFLNLRYREMGGEGNAMNGLHATGKSGQTVQDGAYGHKAGSRGQSMVETALVLPIIILILMGIIDFGLLFNNYIVLSTASREASRKAAVGGTDAEITALVASLTGTLNAADRTTSITPVQALRAHGAQVTVTITYNSQLLTPVVGAFFPDGSAVLVSKTVMRVE